MSADHRGRYGRSPSLHASPAGAHAHLSVLGGLPEVLDDFGINSEKVLRIVGLRIEDLDDPRRSASFRDLDRLLTACVRLTKCEHLGLLVGRRVSLAMLGIAGRLARHSRTVGDALGALGRNFALHDSGSTLQVSIAGDVAVLGYGIRVSGLSQYDQIYDLAAAAANNALRELVGDTFRASAVLLPHRRPRDQRPYTASFNSPVRFNSLHCGIVFPTDLLYRHVAGADPVLHSLLADRAAYELSASDPVLLDDARRAIEGLLAGGGCSRAAVACDLGLHERTLGRRLRAAGTTFQALADATRLQLARQLLCDTDATVERIGRSLGYADSTVFGRSFRRWTGMSATEFRSRANTRR